MWTYRQRTGMLTHDGHYVAHGYSGYEDGKNKPAKQTMHMVGPIPTGIWEITELIEKTMSHGPFVLRLEPAAATVTHGRDGFLIHGDSIQRPGFASHGCIVLPLSVRREIWHSEDRVLAVVSGDEHEAVAA